MDSVLPLRDEEPLVVPGTGVPTATACVACFVSIYVNSNKGIQMMGKEREMKKKVC